MNWRNVAEDISEWIGDYANKNGIEALVVGVSGGVDSAVTSTLSAMTGIDTIVLNMPIHQDRGQFDLSDRHIEWLKSKWGNVSGEVLDLSSTYDEFCSEMEGLSELSQASSRARLRMATLYAIAGSNNGIVVGTGMLHEIRRRGRGHLPHSGPIQVGGFCDWKRIGDYRGNPRCGSD